jgi:putative DNA primase/helicase
MGTSVAVILPINATWVATGNNPSLSDEMTRRVVRIRMDTGLEQPETRTGFRHANLLKWASAHRGDLIAAALTLARAWYVRERHKVVLDVPNLGSFESWASVTGGILKVADIDGFLANIEDVRASAGGERSSQLEAFAVW